MGGVHVQLERKKQRQRRLHAKRQRRKCGGGATSEGFSLKHQQADG